MTMTSAPASALCAHLISASDKTDAINQSAAACAAEAMALGGFSVPSWVTEEVESARDPETGRLPRPGELAMRAASSPELATRLAESAKELKKHGSEAASAFRALVRAECIAAHGGGTVEAIKEGERQAEKLGAVRGSAKGGNAAYEQLKKRLQRHRDRVVSEIEVLVAALTVQKDWKGAAEAARKTAAALAEERSEKEALIALRALVGSVEEIGRILGLAPADTAAMLGGADVAAAVAKEAAQAAADAENRVNAIRKSGEASRSKREASIRDAFQKAVSA